MVRAIRHRSKTCASCFVHLLLDRCCIKRVQTGLSHYVRWRLTAGPQLEGCCTLVYEHGEAVLRPAACRGCFSKQPRGPRPVNQIVYEKVRCEPSALG